MDQYFHFMDWLNMNTERYSVVTSFLIIQPVLRGTLTDVAIEVHKTTKYNFLYGDLNDVGGTTGC